LNLDPKIAAIADYWATAPVFDAKTRSEIKALIDEKNSKELTERFYRNLEFGTGGMRGIVGAGTARMNGYNIRKASAAFALELKKAFGKDGKIKIGITYDSRHFSKEFARITAEVMAGYGIASMITKELRPVPMLSYMVRHFGCSGGVCITASHNPPNYNGFKVYWKSGGQIIPPYDEQVISNYNAIDKYEDIKSIDYEKAKSQGFIEEVGDELDKAYFEELKKLSLHSEGRENFKIVFTPLHGTAGKPVSEALALFGFKDVQVVPEQRLPDANFPTVKFPNPEDPNALAMAVALAKKTNAHLVLGTDPDCDRVGIVVNEGGDFWYLNGNQIGCLLIEYMLSSMKEKNLIPKNGLIIKTIVTTDLQNMIGEEYGCYVEETLTGFKWICQVIEEYETGIRKPYRQYICGGEESYGFLAGSFVRDKDGISSCCLAAEMTAYYKSKGLKLSEVLDSLFRRHGVFHESLYTATLPGKDGAEAIKQIMHRLRTNPPRVIDGVAVEKMRDLSVCQEFLVTPTKLEKSNDLALPRSDVLQFILADGTKISARPSGTEPKIKFYFSVRQPVSKDVSQADLDQAKALCISRTGRIEELFVALTR
jgi:phosphoglucomutase